MPEIYTIMYTEQNTEYTTVCKTSINSLSVREISYTKRVSNKETFLRSEWFDLNGNRSITYLYVCVYMHLYVQNNTTYIMKHMLVDIKPSCIIFAINKKHEHEKYYNICSEQIIMYL